MKKAQKSKADAKKGGRKLAEKFERRKSEAIEKVNHLIAKFALTAKHFSAALQEVKPAEKSAKLVRKSATVRKATNTSAKKLVTKAAKKVAETPTKKGVTKSSTAGDSKKRAKKPLPDADGTKK